MARELQSEAIAGDGSDRDWLDSTDDERRRWCHLARAALAALSSVTDDDGNPFFVGSGYWQSEAAGWKITHVYGGEG